MTIMAFRRLAGPPIGSSPVGIGTPLKGAHKPIRAVWRLGRLRPTAEPGTASIALYPVLIRRRTPHSWRPARTIY